MPQGLKKRDILNALLSAYMLAGEEVFEGEDGKYLAFLKENVHLGH